MNFQQLCGGEKKYKFYAKRGKYYLLSKLRCPVSHPQPDKTDLEKILLRRELSSWAPDA